MKHLSDISIDKVENGFQVTIVKPGEGRLGLLKKENKTYVAESKKKMEEILHDFVEQLAVTG